MFHKILWPREVSILFKAGFFPKPTPGRPLRFDFEEAEGGPGTQDPSIRARLLVE
jgi:hypothetical protein